MQIAKTRTNAPSTSLEEPFVNALIFAAERSEAVLEVPGPSSLVGVGGAATDSLAVSSVAPKLTCMVKHMTSTHIDLDGVELLGSIAMRPLQHTRRGGAARGGLASTCFVHHAYSKPAARLLKIPCHIHPNG